MRILLAAKLLVASAVVAAALICASAGSASAYGCSFGSPFYGPSQYCVYISGSGTWVNSVTGNFAGSADVRNWYITAEFFDANWNWYQTINGPYHPGCCSTGGGNVIYINAYKRTGYMCSTLHYQSWVGGGWSNRAMSVCHRVG